MRRSYHLANGKLVHCRTIIEEPDYAILEDEYGITYLDMSDGTDVVMVVDGISSAMSIVKSFKDEEV